MNVLETILPLMDERYVNERYHGDLPYDTDEMDYVTINEERVVVIL